MKIVIDTNRIIASLIKDSFSRSVIYDKRFEFYYPEGSISEIKKHKDEILEKAGINNEEFNLVLNLLFERIKIIPMNDYRERMEKFRDLIEDVDDIPFLALADAINADGIWSNDRHFLAQNKIKIFTTKKILEI